MKAWASLTFKANMFITMNSGGMGEFVRQSDMWAGSNFTYSYI